MTFTQWYRRTIKQDGRAILWEHVFAFVPAPTAVGLLATRYWQTIWPVATLFALSTIFAVWSWRQDLVVNRNRPDGLDLSVRVPFGTKCLAVVTLLMACWIVIQWFRFGHY